MALKYADRCLEASKTRGTGALVLTGAPPGFRRFVAGFAHQDEVAYCLTSGSDWEIGRGVFSLPSTLTRATVESSSRGGDRIDLTADSTVFAIQPASGFMDRAEVLARIAEIETTPGPVGPAGATGATGPQGPQGPPGGAGTLGPSLAGGSNTTAPGTQSIAWGRDCVASGDRAVAMGDDAIAAGSRSIAMGLDVETQQTYGVSLGSHLQNRGVAAAQVGENHTNQTDSANTSQIGFQTTIGTNSPYSAILACYGNVGNNCTGATAIGQNVSVPDGRPGALHHSSGCTGFAGTGIIDFMRVAAAAPIALLNQQGGAFFPEWYSHGLYEIRIVASTLNGAKTAAAVLLVEVTGGIADITIGALTTLYSTLSVHGWSLAFTEASAGELRVTFDPGPDTARAGMRIELSRIGATFSMA